MKDLPTVAAALTPENWQAELNRMACDSAHDTLHEIGAEGTIELGFALLQTYYMLTYSATLPCWNMMAHCPPVSTPCAKLWNPAASK